MMACLQLMMIQRIVILSLTLSLTACGNHPPLAKASGPYRALNPGRWTPTSDDLRGPRTQILPAESPSLYPSSKPLSPETNR